MKLSQTITCALAAAALCAFLPHGAVAEEASKEAAQTAAFDPLAEELAYIEALVGANMPDFAAPVIEAAKKKWPNAAPKLKVLELKGDLGLGKFDAVQKVVDSLKGKKGQEGEYWGVRLSMADEYYNRGNMAECRKIYDEFFKTVTNPGPDLIDFFVESGFRWAQINVREKNFDKAVEMYGKLLAQSLPEERWCTLALEDVELLLRLADAIPADPKDKNAKKRAGYIKAATPIVDKLLWKNELILVFGKAIAMKAHIEMLLGHSDKAQTFVKDYLPQLSEIHRDLMERDPEGKLGYVRASPMPECRYLLAKMLWDAAQEEAKKPSPNETLIKDNLLGKRENGKRNGLGAYNHAVNVCVKYPESTWAVGADALKDKIENFVNERYKPKNKLKANISAAQNEKIRQMKYFNAHELYRSQEYEKAAEEYKNLFENVKEETEDYVRARGVLADCYLNLRENAKAGSPEKDKYAKLTEEAEDFVATQYKEEKGQPADKDKELLVRAAGNETLRLAAKEKDLKNNDRAEKLYDAYFANYPSHFNAGQTAYLLGTRAYQSEDWGTAIKYYMRLLKYRSSPHVDDALQYLSLCYGKKGDFANQVKCLRAFAKRTKKLDARSTAQLSLAVMLRERGLRKIKELDVPEEAEGTAVTNAIDRVKVLAEANKLLDDAVADFQAAADTLTEALNDSSLDPKVRDQYLARREQALYLAAVTLTQQKPAEGKTSEQHAKAVEAFEKYLQVYPKGKYGASALMRVGTIHTVEKNSDKADDAFARLERDFADSTEAKNSVPLRAKALIEMGMKSEGVAQYRKMLDTDGKYTPGQFLMAGDALLEATSWDVAGEAYAKVSALTNSASYTVPALFGQAKAAYGGKKYAEAREMLEKFVEKHGNSALVIDAYDMLVKAASTEGRAARDNELRTSAFNAAVRALKKLRNYKKDPVEQYELDISSGEVLLDKMEAESAMNLTDAVKDTRARAIVVFQAYLMAHEPKSKEECEKLPEKERELLKRCYERILPLMAVQGGNAEALDGYEKNYKLFFPKKQEQ